MSTRDLEEWIHRFRNKIVKTAVVVLGLTATPTDRLDGDDEAAG